MKIKTYPEMNETIKDLLRRSEEPMNLYIAARMEELEQQVETLDRSRWEGCPLCEKADKISGSVIARWGKLHITANEQFRFCPMCGRPLKPEGG